MDFWLIENNLCGRGGFFFVNLSISDPELEKTQTRLPYRDRTAPSEQQKLL